MLNTVFIFIIAVGKIKKLHPHLAMRSEPPMLSQNTHYIKVTPLEWDALLQLYHLRSS